MNHLFLLCAAVSAAKLSVPVSKDGSYKIQVDGQTWFTSEPAKFRHNGIEHNAVDGLCNFRGECQYQAASGPKFNTDVKVFDDYAVFTQTFPDGAKDTSIGDREKIISMFPRLKPAWSGDKGVVSFQGDMDGQNTASGKWSMSENAKVIGTGIKGSGPIVVFSQDLSQSLVLSAFSNFMAHSQTYDDSILSYGIMGNVTSIPEGYSISTVVYLGSGVNAAMEGWGDILLSQYKKRRYSYKRDLAMQYLGYSTDNGAYYYYTKEKNKTYEDTLVDVQAYAETEKIPYKYILLDSWWYFKGSKGGVKQWDPQPDIFPDGLAGFYKKTNWPTMLHNRYWSPENIYMKSNGGKYNFICDGSKVCVPHDQSFWNDLIANKTWEGMFMYEQDWLNDEFDWSHALGNNATLARTWMLQMNAGAVNSNATIQLCMSEVRHILQSVEMPAVTNARASGDYHPGNGQWNTGTSSILAHAVGIAPSKDNYWSTAVQPDSKYGNKTTEPRSRLQSAVSTLTGGPVAPSDRIGYSNASLINMACDSTGRLLTPDRPAVQFDAYFVHKAFGKDGPNGNLWKTFVDLGGVKYTYILAANLKEPYSFPLADLGYPNSDVVIVDSDSPMDATTIKSDAKFTAPHCGSIDFKFYMAAPVSKGKYTLLGEPDKWISVSSQRFSGLVSDSSSASVNLAGGAGEEVSVRWMTTSGVMSAKCKLSSSGKGVASVSDKGASCA